MKPIKHMTLFLTTNCNLVCDYCFCGRKFKQSMDEQIGRDAIRMFMEKANDLDKRFITFFGGEPTLEWDLMMNLTTYIRENWGERIGLSITSNGTLLTSDRILQLKNNNIQVMLSLDGCEETHDVNRKYANGKGSWEVISRNFKDLIESNTPVRLTFTPTNVHLLADNINELINIGFQRIAFYPACGPEWTEESVEIFYSQMRQVGKVYYESFINNNPISIHWFDKSIKSHIFGSGGKCTPGVTQISVDPKGNIHPCNRVNFADPEYNLGNIYDGINEIVVKELEEQLFKEDPECEECSLKNRCSACPIEMLVYNKELWKVPAYFCAMNQFIIIEADKIAMKLYSAGNEKFMRIFYPEKAV